MTEDPAAYVDPNTSKVYTESGAEALSSSASVPDAHTNIIKVEAQPGSEANPPYTGSAS